MDESADNGEGQSFSELTVELIERVAALAGERLSEPLRAAGGAAARVLVYATCAAGAVIVAFVFAGIAIALLIQQAPETARWWICLVVAFVFFAAAAGIAGAALRTKSRPGPGGSIEQRE